MVSELVWAPPHDGLGGSELLQEVVKPEAQAAGSRSNRQLPGIKEDSTHFLFPRLKYANTAPLVESRAGALLLTSCVWSECDDGLLHGRRAMVHCVNPNSEPKLSHQPHDDVWTSCSPLQALLQHVIAAQICSAPTALTDCSAPE